MSEQAVLVSILTIFCQCFRFRAFILVFRRSSSLFNVGIANLLFNSLVLSISRFNVDTIVARFRLFYFTTCGTWKQCFIDFLTVYFYLFLVHVRTFSFCLCDVDCQCKIINRIEQLHNINIVKIKIKKLNMAMSFCDRWSNSN